MNLKQRLQIVYKEIIDAKSKSSRINDKIRLLAVSKTRQAEDIRSLYHLGQIAFGESYLQEAINKQTQLQDCKIEWHFIGPIQSNKTNLIAQNFDWVQSVCREKIAQRLNNARANKIKALNVLIQINLNNELNKEGINPNDFLDFCHFIKKLPNLKLRGIMAIPQKPTTQKQQADNFSKLNHLFIHHKKEFELDILSMGMSGDYQTAIENGSTLLRIGTKLFGPRIDSPPTDK